MTESLELSITHPDGSLDLAIFDWDPSEHPRDLVGKFRRVLNGLGDGASARLPDGVRVKVRRNRKATPGAKAAVAKSTAIREQGRVFEVDGGGEVVEFDDPDTAIDEALDRSKTTPYKSQAKKILGKIGRTLDTAMKIERSIRDLGASDETLNARKKRQATDAIWEAAIGKVTGKKDSDIVWRYVTDLVDAENRKQQSKLKRELATWFAKKAAGGLNRVAADQGDVDLDLVLALEQEFDEDGGDEDAFDVGAYRLALAGERRPPNLRDASGRTACGTCAHYEHQDEGGTCVLYSFPVAPSDVCDSWVERRVGVEYTGADAN